MAPISSAEPDWSVKKSFGEKLAEFLKEFPEQCDVTFSVGPQKTKIKSLRVALVASSLVIHKLFKDKWDAEMTKCREIQLPDLEPAVFEAFLKILMSDDWSSDGIQEMNLSVETVFKLIEISQTFKLLDLEHSLHESIGKFFENFESFVNSDEFLKLPIETFEIILSSNLIPVPEASVFKAALKWAKSQCLQRLQNPTGQNLRQILGPLLFQIRFPIMTSTQFSNVVGTTGILSEVEEVHIMKYILLSDENKATFDASDFPFKTEVRQTPAMTSSGGITLKFFRDLDVVDRPHYTCDGNLRETWLSVDTKLALESVGFLGPINHNSYYEVFVQILKKNSDGNWTSLQKVSKIMKVKCKKKFEITFEPPVIFEATYITDEFNEKISPFYGIIYSLKGNRTQSVLGTNYNYRTEISDVVFYWGTTRGPKPLQYLKFKRI